MFVKIVILLTVLVHPSVQLERLDEGELCRNNDGVQGVCKRFKLCSTAVLAIRNKNPPKICSFVDEKPVICCPPEKGQNSQNQSPGKPPGVSSTPTIDKNAVAIAKRKCAEYAKSVMIEVEDPALTAGSSQTTTINLCGRVEEALVLGGEKAHPREYPHMALIGYRDTNIKWLCGGSLISERFVLSAAHCSNPRLFGTAKWVKLGELDQSTDYDDASPIVIKISQIINHPEYRPPRLYNDITLFKLANSVIFNEYIRPTCLSTSYDIPWHTALATGWGHTEWGGRGSPSLQKVRLNLVRSEDCFNKYRNSSGKVELPNGIINTQVCAGDERGKDTCQGDSGGPLQSPIDDPYCMYELIGVTSFGKACGKGFPGVYTRVASHLPWIVKNVWPN